MKKKKESNYVYFNPNPTARYKKNGEPYKWDKGDCSTRAICGATGLSWIEAFKLQYEKALELYDMQAMVSVVGAVLESLGFEKVVVKPKKGETRPTPSSLARDNVGYSGVANVASHFVCFDDGVYKDVWDSGDKGVYSYWIRKKC